MAQSLKKQALTLTIANAYTRALGFVLRLITARLMGAEAMGVMELSGSAVMLAITPVTAGIPTAMSRLTARPGADERAVLQSGLAVIRRLSLWLIPSALLLAPAAAWLLGDMRTLPSILAGAPLIWLLGICTVYSGWCCGRADMRTPAWNECIEQTVRCVLCVVLLMGLKGSSTAVTAALPGAAEVVAGVVVWRLFRRCTPPLSSRSNPELSREILRLSAPTAAARLCQTAMRALNAVLLPVCLRRSGLSASAATAQFGLLGGMAMPLLMLPGIITGAICTVSAPAIARQEKQPRRLRRTMRMLLLSASGIGTAAAALLFFGAELISSHLYSEPSLSPLLKVMCPSALLMAVQQVQFGLITGLGVQRKALTGTVAASAFSLIVTALLCPLPTIRLYGAGIATVLSALMRVVWNQAVLHRAVHRLTC